MSFLAELKRRNVIRVAVAYGLLGWVVLQGADFLLDLGGAPDWVIRAFAVAGLVGLPFVLFFAWAFELTPEGIRREKDVDRKQSITSQTGRRLDRLIILFLVAAVALLLVDRFAGSGRAPDAGPGADTVESGPPASTPVAAAADERRSVAVLPFMAMSDGVNDGYFADGLTEEILNSLAQLPELLVTARTSAFSFKGQDLTVQEIAQRLGVAHVVEGSVRRSGDRLRVTAQLIRAGDGFHLWSENYDSTSQDTIQVQEDIAEQIASALDVVLDEKRREAMRRAGLRDVEAFIDLQKGFERSAAAHGEYEQVAGLLDANHYFDRVLERVPGYPPALIEHADAYVHLLHQSSFETGVPAIRERMEQALEQAVSDYQAAAANARSFDERAAIEFDLSAITGDLRGIQRRLQAYLDSDTCEKPAWVDPVATVFGHASRFAERMDRVRDCDPLVAIFAFTQARAVLWAGNPEQALEIATQAREATPHPWLDHLIVEALLAQGQIETAASEAVMPGADDNFRLFNEVLLGAMAGDRERAGRAYQDLLQRRNFSDFETLQLSAVMGRREEANQAAARVDQLALGPLPLMLGTLWCACGAPFDLEAAPNFAAKLQEGELPWPPATAIEFPLKDW